MLRRIRVAGAAVNFEQPVVNQTDKYLVAGAYSATSGKRLSNLIILSPYGEIGSKRSMFINVNETVRYGFFNLSEKFVDVELFWCAISPPTVGFGTKMISGNTWQTLSEPGPFTRSKELGNRDWVPIPAKGAAVKPIIIDKYTPPKLGCTCDSAFVSKFGQQLEAERCWNYPKSGGGGRFRPVFVYRRF